MPRKAVDSSSKTKTKTKTGAAAGATTETTAETPKKKRRPSKSSKIAGCAQGKLRKEEQEALERLVETLDGVRGNKYTSDGERASESALEPCRGIGDIGTPPEARSEETREAREAEMKEAEAWKAAEAFVDEPLSKMYEGWDGESEGSGDEGSGENGAGGGEIAPREAPPQKARHKGPKTMAEWDKEHLQPGENSKYVRHALIVANLPPIDIADPDQVERRIMWYFKYCIEQDMKPSVVGMCNAVGISCSTITTWRNGAYRDGTNSNVIRKAYSILHALWQDYMQNGKINPVAGIYLGANMFGYKNANEVIVKPQETVQHTQEELEEKYRDLVDEGDTIETTATDVEA